MDTKGRILQYAENKGYDERELERKLSLGRNYFKNTAKVSVDVVSKFLSLFCEVSPDWVIFGREPILREPLNGSLFSYHKEYVEGAIPYYEDLPVSAGQWDLSRLPYNEKPSGWIKLNEVFSAIGAFPVVGCSMEPFIRPGDFIAVAPLNSWDRIDPDKTYMVITQDDRMIKHLVIDNDDPDIIWCMSPNYPKFKIQRDDIKAIWRITFHGKLM